MQVKYGKYVTLTVSAKGSSHLSYKWRKDGRLIPGDKPTPFIGAKSPTLFIQEYTPNHAGNYECLVSSEIDNVKTPAIKLRGKDIFVAHALVTFTDHAEYIAT